MKSQKTIEEFFDRFYYWGGTLFYQKKCGTRVKAGDEVKSKDRRGYISVCVNYKVYRVHRVIWAMNYGKLPRDQIDHINGNTLDNRIENLRDVSQSENQRNQKVHRAGKLPGARLRSGRFQAAKKVNGKSIHLGTFDTEEEACLMFLFCDETI